MKLSKKAPDSLNYVSKLAVTLDFNKSEFRRAAEFLVFGQIFVLNLLKKMLRTKYFIEMQ